MHDNNTYIKLWRSFKKWEWYDDINTKVLFLHCLLSANYESKTWHGITILTGQFVTSFNKLSLETGLSVQNVRTSINKLISTGELTKQSTNDFTIITVNNWDSYQETNIRSNKRPTNDQQTTNKRLTTTKEIKEYKEYKEDNILSFSKMVVDHLNKKTGKAYRYSDTTLRHIKARLNDGYTLEDCKKVIDIKCSQWLHNDMEKFLRPETLFGSKFETYLNEKPKAPSFMVNDERPGTKATHDQIEETRKMLNDITKKV